MNYIYKYIQLENSYIHSYEIIFHNIAVLTVFFDQINASLVSKRDFFQIPWKNLTNPKRTVVNNLYNILHLI